MKKIGFRHYVLCFAGSVVLAVALLLLCACLPQGPIDAHVREAALLLRSEGAYPINFDGANSAQLDNYTEAIILDVSRGTRLEDPASVLTNPVHREVENPVDALAIYAEQEADAAPSFYYPRYWMGFRILTRLALVFFNYAQIRRYLSVLFFCLAALAMLSVARNAGTRAAFFFALSLVLVRPQIICQSMQLSCCFLIAMLGMLLVPWVHRNRQFEGLFFLELGVTVMYFDFYTAPILAFGLPMVYLCLLDARSGAGFSWKRLGRDVLAWLCGYGLMWLAKLCLTSLFTPENALETGLASFFTRVGVTKAPGEEALYSPLRALWTVKFIITADRTGKVVWAIGLLGTALALGVNLLRGRCAWSSLWRNGMFLVLALLPLLWFAAAAQPTSIHAWFQYRSIAMSYWAAGAWLSCCLPSKNHEIF